MLLSACYYATSHSVPLVQPFTLGRKVPVRGVPQNRLTWTSDLGPMEPCGTGTLACDPWHSRPIFQPCPPPHPHFTPFHPTHTPGHPTLTPACKYRLPTSPHPFLVLAVSWTLSKIPLPGIIIPTGLSASKRFLQLASRTGGTSPLPQSDLKIHFHSRLRPPGVMDNSVVDFFMQNHGIADGPSA
jgi:hypothetical protein